MKVLFFCNLIPSKLGSFEAWLVELGRVFRAKQDELVVALAGEPIPAVARLLDEAGVERRLIAGWGTEDGTTHPWHFCRPARRIALQERPDVAVVHFGNELPCIVLYLMSRISGLSSTAWVWQQHQQIADPSPIAAKCSRIRLLSFFFDHFTAVYDGGRVSLERRSISPERISVIYNAIPDGPRTKHPGWLRRELGLPENTVLLAHVGWLIPRKRVDRILRNALVWKEKAKQPFRLILVGDGPLRHDLESRARVLGLADQVVFLGLRNDVREILYESDILVHMSRAETCTYAISEAMACSIPAVASDAGAAREQILDGVSGHVTGAEDHDIFAERVIELIDDPKRRASLGAAARKRYEQRYRMQESVRRYHELYAALGKSR